MGTRGLYGFVKNDQKKLTYCHFDSYPTGLGQNIINFIKNTSIKEMNEIFDKIILVNKEDIPTEEQINECIKYSCNQIGKINEWYVLLRETQGDLNVYKNDCQYMIDNQTFIEDKLFCEWAYIINLDTNKLEIFSSGNIIKNIPLNEIDLIDLEMIERND